MEKISGAVFYIGSFLAVSGALYGTIVLLGAICSCFGF